MKSANPQPPSAVPSLRTSVVALPRATGAPARFELAFLPAALEIVETPPSPIGRAIACHHHRCCSAVALALGVRRARSTSVVGARARSSRAAAPRSSSRSRPASCARSSVAGRPARQGRRRPDRARSDHERGRARSSAQRPCRRAARRRAPCARRSPGATIRWPTSSRRPAPARTLVAMQRSFLLSQVTEQRAKIAALAPPAGAEGGRARHRRRHDRKARADHSVIAAARRHPQVPRATRSSVRSSPISTRVPGPGRASKRSSRCRRASLHEADAAIAGDPARPARRRMPSIGARSPTIWPRPRQKAAGLAPGRDQGRAEDQAAAADRAGRRRRAAARGAHRRRRGHAGAGAARGRAERQPLSRSRPWCRTATSASSTPGQEAEIKIDTFNFTRYGLLHGQVLSVPRTRSHAAPQKTSSRATNLRPAMRPQTKGPGTRLCGARLARSDQMRVDDKVWSSTRAWRSPSRSRPAHAGSSAICSRR